MKKIKINSINISSSKCSSIEELYNKSILSVDCGEIPLNEFGSCRLTVLNLLNHVENPFTENAYFNFNLFSENVKIAQRLMDDIVDLEIEKCDAILSKIESDPENDNTKFKEIEIWQNIKKDAINGRRTGLGITALGDMFAALNIGYATEESLQLADKIFKHLRDYSFMSSAEMSRDLGPFSVYNPDLEKDNIFLLRIKNESPEVYDMIMKHGRRNIDINTISPSGSVSLMTQTTSGIEPLFMVGYKRRKKLNPEDLLKDKSLKVDFVDQNGDKWQEYVVYHPTINKWKEHNIDKTVEESPWFRYCADDLNWENRVKLQSIAQRYIGHSISSTLNLPENVSINEVKKIYETAWESGCKGVTVYRKNSRSGVLIEDKPKEKQYDKFIQHSAIKRPKSLNGEIHHLKIKGQEFYVTVGLLDEKPYEIFIGENHINEELEKNIESQVRYRIPKKTKNGTIVKFKRGEYDLIIEENEKYRLTGNVANADIDALTRMISTSLRHGVAVDFVVQQLEKINGFDNFPKALSKTLKKYILNGTKVSGEECPSCGSRNLIRQDGCVTCSECGWSRCS